MTDQEKTQNTRLAMAVAGIQVSDPVAEMTWRIRELLTQKGQQVTLEEVAKIENAIRDKYSAKQSNIVKPNMVRVGK